MAMPQCDRNQTSIYLNRRGLNSFFTVPFYLTGREIFQTGREPPYLGSFINSISKYVFLEVEETCEQRLNSQPNVLPISGRNALLVQTSIFFFFRHQFWRKNYKYINTRHINPLKNVWFKQKKEHSFRKITLKMLTQEPTASLRVTLAYYWT